MQDLRGKRVLVVGLARSGRAAALCLSRRGAVVTVTDRKPPAAFQAVIPELAAQKIGLELGMQRVGTFLRHDVIIVSPGVPWDLPELQAARGKGIPVFPEIEAASWFLKGRLVGITGTNGKSTTTSLLGRILEASGFSTFVGGNIGVPLISLVDQVTSDSLVVAELSSYQLEPIQDFHPHVAVLLNVTSHHTDRHRSFEEYLRAKARIFQNQGSDDYAILNADDPVVMSLAAKIASRKICFSRCLSLPEGVLASNGRIYYRVGHLERVLLEAREIPLRGDFNLENVMAAAAAACMLGADFDALRKAVREFKGLPHRLEFVREIRGVDFYNDSKATSVDAASKAMGAFESGVHLILGGKDEGASFELLKPCLKDRVRTVYLIGAAAERMAQDLSGAAELIRAGNLETATRKAFEQAQPGDTVLLAPACPSFDQFQDFEHRGSVFKEIVETLAREAAISGFGIRNSGLGKQSSGNRRQNSSPKSVAASIGPLLPTGEPETPNLESRIPNAESPASKPELVYVYEVEAEEVRPMELHASGEREEEGEITKDLRPAESCQDDALPFEVRSSGVKAEADATGRAHPKHRKSRPGQSRLPGM